MPELRVELLLREGVLPEYEGLLWFEVELGLVYTGRSCGEVLTLRVGFCVPLYWLGLTWVRLVGVALDVEVLL